MKASVKWLNRLVPGAPLSAAEVEAALTDAGFPIDGREALADGDTRLEVEITSNRGDCLSHVGLARELGAKTGRAVLIPPVQVEATGGPAGAILTLANEAGSACPRFTAQVIRGITVGPSPGWLVEALAAVGQRSINNVVDVTNYITFEMGQPTHVFDLGKLAGPGLVVRVARAGEALTTLDGKKRTLAGDEVVVSDAQRAQSLAGVMGGADSEVSASTRDVVLEAATWDPSAVRRAARRHQLRTDASHRFERIVTPATIPAAAARAAALIVQVAGGRLCSGVLDTATGPWPAARVMLRLSRVRAIVGVEIPAEAIVRILGALEIGCERRGESLECVIPAHRPDVAREIDLIEEVARIHGLDRVPMSETMRVVVRPPQPAERAARELGATLTGLGFFETITYSFETPGAAALFQRPGTTLLAVDDARRAGDGTLRPSVLASLLACRARNASEAGVRLYETASVFAGLDAARWREERVLSLLVDVPGATKGRAPTIDQQQEAIRLVRGAIEAVAAVLTSACVSVRAETPDCPGFEPGTFGRVMLGEQEIGRIGLASRAALGVAGADIPAALAEVALDRLIEGYPPKRRVEALAAFPGIERDVSLVVDEAVTWERVRGVSTGLPLLEGAWFIGTFRGKQVGAGKKSVTIRLAFRDPARTIRHEEVDPQVGEFVRAAAERLGAVLRG
ncbi:MAG: phenylalanine--tRNA ligase subunit beta [Phycisphaerae bacterium]|nr:phenylalanine--tRNA ligase subunit beta [Phycisphaerae bacterium]